MLTGDIQSVTRPELLQVADAVARDKAIDRDIVIEAIEQAIQTAAQRKYGQERDIRATIEPRSGEIRLIRVRQVVEEVEDEALEIGLADARSFDAALGVGDELVEALPPFDIGRLAAQAAKQVIVQRVRDAERDRQFEEYKDRVGEIVNGLVKRDDYGGVVVDLGRAEGVMRRDESLPRERFHDGDRLRALIYDVRREPRGPQIFLSRSRPEFMAKLFRQEVPEVYDNIIEIRAVARDPGSRAKIAVLSNDMSIDPVGACVGMRGSRVQAVVGELQGEKIDIIQWNGDPATFIVNALAPAEVTKVVLDEGNEPHRSGGPRRPVEPRHRAARSECSPRLAAHRMGYRHHDRRSGVGASHRRAARGVGPVHGSPQRRRRHRPSPGGRRLHRCRIGGVHAGGGTLRDRGIRRGRTCR